MRVFQKIRFSGLFAVLGAFATIVTLASCGGDSARVPPTTPATPTTPTKPTPPPTPTSSALTMTIVTVKSQSLPAGDLPTQAMGVKLTDSLGVAVANVAVTWAVTAGGGSLRQSTNVTDNTGVALALWILGPTTGTQQLTVSSTRVTTPATFTGTVPIGAITFAAPTTRLYVGDTFALNATVKDTKGTVLTGVPALVVRDTFIAAQLVSGSLVSKSDGATYAVAVVGPLNTPKDSVKLDVYRELHGAVWTWDDSPLPALRAYSTNGGVTDSADVAPNGTYRMKLTSHASGFATEVLIDAVNTSARAFFPALIPVATDCSMRNWPNCIGSDITADVTFILVPMQYKVKRGLYAGRTLAVDLNAAMVASMATGPAYYMVSAFFQFPAASSGKAPKLQNTYLAGEEFWLPDSFPIGVAIHRACCSTRTVVPDDSVQVMRALSTIQNTLGYDIWRPISDNAAFNYNRLTSATPNRVLIFQFDTTVKRGKEGGGSTGPIASNNGNPQSLMSQDFVVTGWRNSATDHVAMADVMSLSQVVVWNPAFAGQMSQVVLIHETMHALGVGHGCSWPSTQSYCGMNAPDTLPSFEDAAYLLLAMDVKSAAWKHRALHSLTAGLFGQRAIMLKIDPIPAPWTIPDPGSKPATDVSPVQSRGVGARRP